MISFMDDMEPFSISFPLQLSLNSGASLDKLCTPNAVAKNVKNERPAMNIPMKLYCERCQLPMVKSTPVNKVAVAGPIMNPAEKAI